MKLNNTGQSLLESLLAIAIILIGIVSLVTLLVRVIAISTTALAETKATRLGQEAIEAARYVRDSNWLKREDGVIESNGRLRDYANGLRASNDTTAIYVWNPNPGISPDAAFTFNFNNGDTLVYQDSSGRYLQTAGSTSGLTATQFHRLVTVQPICFDIVTTNLTTAELILTDMDKTCATTGSTNQYVEIGMQITVTVSWTSRGNITQRNFVEKLYNWKYADSKVLP